MDNPIVIEIETPEQACEIITCHQCPVHQDRLDMRYCDKELFNLIRERGMIVKVKEE